MVVHRRALSLNVVEAARQRLINICSNDVRVYVSVSGGKDSIVLADLLLNLIKEGRVDPSKVIAVFIDEEAMFDEAIRTTKDLRRRFIAAGCEFRWYCVEVKHFNCFNQLTNDESFICWDSTMPERWVRPMPSFAITDHPLLKRREENYQSFLPKVCRDGVSVVGVRVAESIQRLYKFNQHYDGTSGLFQPIYDWKDADVWRYIKEHELDFPDTYLHLYQIGRSRREMRISQFFSIDTAKVLVRLGEHEPDLMERIIRREPNAYLASLYWDTEMFRHAGGSGHQATDDGKARDYRAEVIRMVTSPLPEDMDRISRSNHLLIRKYIVGLPVWTEKNWKTAYNILTAGDPKQRSMRALIVALAQDRSSMDDRLTLGRQAKRPSRKKAEA